MTALKFGSKFGIGQSVIPLENYDLVTGRGHYSDDVAMENCLHMFVVRSQYAHGTIKHIDISRAQGLDGVRLIITPEIIKQHNVLPIPCLVPIKRVDGAPHHMINQPILADGVVRFVGEPIVAIIADSYELARDAADFIDIQIEPIQAVVRLADATNGKTPTIWQECPQNINFVWGRGNREGTDLAIKNADRVFSFDIVNQRVSANPIEPRCCLSFVDEDIISVHLPTQGVHHMHRAICQSLGLSDDALRVQTQDVGGGFGMKIFPHTEYMLNVLATKILRVPVRWRASRLESLQSDKHGRDNLTKMTVALDKNNRITAMRADTLANMGAYLSSFATYIPTDCGALMIGLLYDIPNLYAEVTGVMTNTAPVDAYRGAGRPEACYATDRAMEIVARKIGEDSLAFRARHLIKPEQLPFTNAMRNIYDSGDYPEMFQRGLQFADYQNFAARQKASHAQGLLRGFGVCYYSEACGAGPGESAVLRAMDDGSVSLFIGTQNNGQGQRTALSQVVAELLELPLDKIHIITGDTKLVQRGNGTGGSRLASEGGSVAKQASLDFTQRAKEFAGLQWEANAEDIEYSHGQFRVKGTDLVLSIGDLAIKAQHQNVVLEGSADYKGTYKTFPNGLHAVEVEVDPQTGKFAIKSYTVYDDFGRVINPILLESQVHGGIAQGIGQAMMEIVKYDDDGQLVTASFMDYAMPRADDLPNIQFNYTTDYPTANNLLGVKGAGEAGAIAAPSALVNAVENALGTKLKRNLQMPVTSESVWRAMC